MGEACCGGVNRFHVCSFGCLEPGAAQCHSGLLRFLCDGPVSLQHPRANEPRPAELLQRWHLEGQSHRRPLRHRPWRRPPTGSETPSNRTARSSGSRDLLFQGEIAGDVRNRSCTTVFSRLPEEKSHVFFFRLECSKVFKFTYINAARIHLQRGTKAALAPPHFLDSLTFYHPNQRAVFLFKY